MAERCRMCLHCDKWILWDAYILYIKILFWRCICFIFEIHAFCAKILLWRCTLHWAHWAHIQSDDIQLAHTSKSDVIWDQTCLCTYKLQIPYEYVHWDSSSRSFGEIFGNYLNREIPQTGQTGRTAWLTFKLDFQDTCGAVFCDVLEDALILH